MNLPQYNSYGVKIADVEIPQKLIDSAKIFNSASLTMFGISVILDNGVLRLPVQRVNHVGVPEYVEPEKPKQTSNYVSPIYVSGRYAGD